MRSLGSRTEVGALLTLGVAVSFLFRLTTQVGWGLVGGALWAMARGRRRHASTQETA